VGDVLLALLRDASASLALLLGTSTLTTILVLLGATTLAAVTVALVARGATALGLVPLPVRAAFPHETVAARPAVTQSDPDAPGHARPRAPGSLLG
jgi:hypothetical protein